MLRILMRILKRFWACGEVAGQNSLANCDGENALELLANDASMRTCVGEVKVAH